MKDSPQTNGSANHDVVLMVYHAPHGAENSEKYRQDAHGNELRRFFEEARDSQRRIAREGKRVLQPRLGEEVSSVRVRVSGHNFGAAMNDRAAEGDGVASENTQGSPEGPDQVPSV